MNDWKNWHFVFEFFILGSNSEAQAFLQRNGQVIIRMRGLPFDATAKDVVERDLKNKKNTHEFIYLF